jgi:aromatic ring-opening dioxygenase catalytic subunit (LigB family)
VLFSQIYFLLAMAQRQPAFFISHGGGPCFFMDSGGKSPFCYMDKNSKITQWYKDFQKNFVTQKPSAIIIFSAHWEEDTVHILSKPKPDLYFDYYGFPDFTYSFKYPAPGDSHLSERIKSLVEGASIPVQLDSDRNWDHGVFVPLLLMFPEADIPVVQVSLISSLNPETHIKLGAALEPLRNENILFIGSGFATHTSGGRSGGFKSVLPFTDWLTDTVTNKDYTKEQKTQKLINWSTAPEAKFTHPREEHLIPVHIIMGSSSGSATQILNFVDVPSTLGFCNYKFD